MNKITVYDNDTRFERISKSKARQMFYSGKLLVFCPVNLYPFGGFRPSVVMDISSYGEHRDFAWVVKEFDWYNCNCYETGYYTAFYINSELLKDYHANK